MNILAARLARTAAAPPPSPWQDRADSWSASFSGRSASKHATPPSAGAAPRRVARADDGRDVPRQPATPGAGRSPESPPLSARSRASATAAAAAAAAVAHLAMDQGATETEKPTTVSPSRLRERRRAKASERDPETLTALDVSPRALAAPASSSRRRSVDKSPRSPGAAGDVWANGNTTSPRGVASQNMISPRGNAHTHASPHAERELRERARRAETRASRAEAATRDAERAHLVLTRKRIAAERAAEEAANELSRLSVVSSQTESALRACESSLASWRARAISLERLESTNRLAPDQATDCFLKAGFLAHYWRLAYRLGIEPKSSWREAETWTRRAPKGGDEALLNVVRAVRDAAAAGNTEGPAFCRPSAKGAKTNDIEKYDDADRLDETRVDVSASKYTQGRGPDVTVDAYAAFAPAPRVPNGWAPATQADLVEVETAMRALVSARIEESVLVALADRRRALANRAVKISTASDGARRMSGFDVLKSDDDAVALASSPLRSPSEDTDEKKIERKSFASSEFRDDASWIVLSDAEVGEVKYRRLWVCWQWARARGRGHATGLAGLAEPRCDTWFRRAFGEQAVFAAAREALEVEGALREIRTLGVERALCAAANAAT